MSDDPLAQEPAVSGSESKPLRAPDYEIGHGRPPKHTQWKKGQSGNPRGRPKEQPIDLLASFKGMLDEAITNGSDGKAMTKRELMVRALFQQAMRCNQRAFGRFLKLAKKAGLLKGLKLPWSLGGGVLRAPLVPELMQRLEEFRKAKAAAKRQATLPLRPKPSIR